MQPEECQAARSGKLQHCLLRSGVNLGDQMLYFRLYHDSVLYGAIAALPVPRTVGGRKNHEGLQWFSGFHHLDSGNIVVANWLGHGKAGKGPHLVEFDKDNKLVWKWEDHQKAKQITNVLILDDLNGQLE